MPTDQFVFPKVKANTMSITTLIRGTFAALFAALMLTAPAGAQASDPQIAAAYQQGVIGEQADGLIGFVRPNAAKDPELERKVAAINIGRRQLYIELAQKSGETVQNVATVTALKLIDRMPAGQMYRDGDGTWKRK
jgi:uncharacterized protein